MPWIFDHAVQISKQVEVQFGARSASAYGNRYIYDQTKPQEQATFRGELIDETEWTTLLTAVRTPMSEAGNIVTLNVQGQNWQGNITSLSGRRVMGSTYREVEVTLFEASPV